MIIFICKTFRSKKINSLPCLMISSGKFGGNPVGPRLLPKFYLLFSGASVFLAGFFFAVFFLSDALAGLSTFLADA